MTPSERVSLRRASEAEARECLAYFDRLVAAMDFHPALAVLGDARLIELYPSFIEDLGNQIADGRRLSHAQLDAAVRTIERSDARADEAARSSAREVKNVYLLFEAVVRVEVELLPDRHDASRAKGRYPKDAQLIAPSPRLTSEGVELHCDSVDACH